MSQLTPPVSETSFDQEVLKSEVPVLVDFWAEWCGPCRAIAPILEELAPAYQGKLKIVKLNVDEAGAVAAKFSVMNIPTLIFFNGGKEVERVVGVAPKEDLENRIRKILG